MANRLGVVRSGLGGLKTLQLLEFLKNKRRQMARNGAFPSAGADRRQHPRFPCMLDTSFRPIGQDGSFLPDKGYIKCKAINISEGGLLLEGDVYVPQGQRLEIFVKLEDNFKTIAGEAEAVRWKETHGKFHIGVKFVKKEII